MEAVADEVDATPAQVAIRWAMDLPDLTSVPIVGARSIGHVDENVGALEVTLSDDQYHRILDAGAPW